MFYRVYLACTGFELTTLVVILIIENFGLSYFKLIKYVNYSVFSLRMIKNNVLFTN